MAVGSRQEVSRRKFSKQRPTERGESPEQWFEAQDFLWRREFSIDVTFRCDGGYDSPRTGGSHELHSICVELVTLSLGRTRVTVVEDHLLFAEALDVALTLEGHDVRRVETDRLGPGTGQLCAAILRTRPSVVLLDLDLGHSSNGLSAVAPLAHAGIAVIVVTGSASPARWGECLSHGARTVLPKSTPLNTILATIRMIGEGRRVLSREERDRLLLCYHQESCTLRGIRARLETLSPREREILAELMAGQQVCEIARDACVSEATVRTQVRSILAKLEVSSQLAAVGTALKVQWHEPRSARSARSA